jgi:hypothetical protein
MIGWSLSLGVLPNELGPWVTATYQPGTAQTMSRLSHCVSIGPKYKSNHNDYFKKYPVKVVSRPCFRKTI